MQPEISVPSQEESQLPKKFVDHGDDSDGDNNNNNANSSASSSDFFWKSDACIRNVNLSHGVEFVSPVYLSRFTKQHRSHHNNNNNDHDHNKNSNKTQNAVDKIEERNGILFLSGPDSDSRVQRHQDEQDSRRSNLGSNNKSANKKSYSATHWALERVVAVPSATNASEWLGDVNRCIIRLRQSMKRSSLSKLNQTVTSHMNVAVFPLETRSDTVAAAEVSDRDSDGGKDRIDKSGEKEKHGFQQQQENNSRYEQQSSFVEYLVLREGLHAPKSKRLLHYFDRLPISSQNQLDNKSDFSSENIGENEGEEEDEEETKRVALGEAHNFKPFYVNDKSDDAEQKIGDESSGKENRNNSNSNSFYLSVSSPSALSAPRNHNDQPVHYARNWISTRVSGSTVPYYSFLTGNSLNIDELHFTTSSTLEENNNNNNNNNNNHDELLDESTFAQHDQTTSVRSNQQLPVEDDDQDDEIEEDFRNNRTQQLRYNNIIMNSSTSSLFSDVLKSQSKQEQLQRETNRNNNNNNNNNNSNNNNGQEGGTIINSTAKNEPTLFDSISTGEYVLVSPVEIAAPILPFIDDDAEQVNNNNKNDLDSSSTHSRRKSDTTHLPLQEHENLHNRIQQNFDVDFHNKNEAKFEASARVFDKLVESPEYAMCFDLVDDGDKKTAASIPVRKLHNLDAENVNADELFTLSKHAMTTSSSSKSSDGDFSRKTASLFPVRAGFLNESDDIFSSYLARVLVHPLSSVFRLMHFNVNAFPVGAETTEIHSAVHAVVGQSDEDEFLAGASSFKKQQKKRELDNKTVSESSGNNNNNNNVNLFTFVAKEMINDISQYATSLVSIRPWLVDFYWDKTKVPLHSITAESERFAGGRCEVTFAQSPSWSFFASWKDRSISQKQKSFFVSSDLTATTNTKPNQQQQQSKNSAASADGGNNSNNNNNVAVASASHVTSDFIVDYLKTNREASSAQVSPSPKKYSAHRDPTRAGILPHGAVRKRPQVGTTREGANLDATVKDDILRRNQEIGLLRRNGGFEQLQQQQQQAPFEDFDYTAEFEDDFNNNNNNNNNNDEEEGNTKMDRRRSVADRLGRQEAAAGLDDTEVFVELDATTNEATALLISELQNIIQQEDALLFQQQQQQQQQQRRQISTNINDNNKNNNNSNRKTSLPPLHLSKLNDSPQIFQESPPVLTDNNNNIINNNQQVYGRRLESEFRRAASPSNDENNNYYQNDQNDDDNYYPPQHNAKNNNGNNNNHNNVAVFTVPEFADLAHAKDHKRAQQIAENMNNENKNTNKDNFEKVSRKRILEQLSTRITAGCKKRYETQFATTPLGMSVDENKIKQLSRKSGGASLAVDEKPKIIQVADGRTIEVGTNYHYRWTRDWDVDELSSPTSPPVFSSNGENSKSVNLPAERDQKYTYRSFWDKLELRASCSLLYGFTQATPEFAELTAPLIPQNKNQDSVSVPVANNSNNNNNDNTVLLSPSASSSFPISRPLPPLPLAGGVMTSSSSSSAIPPLPTSATPTTTTSFNEQQRQLQQQQETLHRHNNDNNDRNNNNGQIVSDSTVGLGDASTNNRAIRMITASSSNVPSREERTFARRNYLQIGGGGGAAASIHNTTQNSTNTNQNNTLFPSAPSPSSPPSTTMTTQRVSKLYSVLNASAAWIGERHLSATSLLRFRGGFRWSLASDADSVPYLDSPSSISSVSSGNDRSYSDFFKSSAYLSSIFSSSSATCVHQPQTAFALEVESKRFLPFGIKTNLFCGGTASCRILDGSDFLSVVTRGTSIKSDFNGNNNNANLNNNNFTKFSSLVASSCAPSSSTKFNNSNHDSSSANKLNKIVAPAVARAAESRVRDYLDGNAQNGANNFLTSTLNLRAMAEFAAGFSFFIPLARQVDAYTENDGVDGYSKRLEFSWWIPLWTYDSFDMRKFGESTNNGGQNNDNNNNNNNRKRWNYRMGVNLIL